jgi:hypothetical protein
MTVPDDRLTARERQALAEHVVGCASCAREERATTALFAALGSLPMEADVPVRLEQDTLRRVRLAGDEPAPRDRWWSWLLRPLPAVALVATLAVAVLVTFLQRGGPVPSRPGAPATQVAKVDQPRPAAPVAVARAVRREPRHVPDEPPPVLAAAPDLFVDLPILRHLEKLEHFEAIRTTTLDDGPAGTGQQQGDNG